MATDEKRLETFLRGQIQRTMAMKREEPGPVEGSLRARFVSFDDRLATKGVPPMTTWWREAIGGWLDSYERGGPLELWGCVGRGAAKSTALYKLAMFFATETPVTVPPGERHFAVILSRLKEEAGKGVQIVHRWLDLLGIRHSLAGDVIELADSPRGIRVVAASVSAASGWRAFFVGKDERSKWPEAGDSPNVEAVEIDASAVAMTATHPTAPIVSFGSAWLRWGKFNQAIEGGTDAGRHVIGPAPTWVAAPHITEESTRRKERNLVMWKREYACIASEGTEESLFSPELLDRCTRRGQQTVPKEPGVTYVAFMDPALYRNAWTLVVAGRRKVGERIRRSIVYNREWRPERGMPLDPDPVLKDIRGAIASYGLDSVYSDQAGMPHVSNAMRLGLNVHILTSTQARKIATANDMLVRLSDGEDELPPDPQLRADLLNVRQVLIASGFTIRLIETPDGRHSDYAPPAMGALDLCRLDPVDVPHKLTRAELGTKEGHAKHWDQDYADDPIERAAMEAVDRQTAEDEWQEKFNGGLH